MDWRPAGGAIQPAERRGAERGQVHTAGDNV